MCFYIFFTVKFFGDLWIAYKNKSSANKQATNQYLGPRGNEDERSCCLKFVNFIGIDE